MNSQLAISPKAGVFLVNSGGVSAKGLHSVAQVFDAAAFDRATDPLLQFITRDQAEALVARHGHPPLRNRIDELASKSTEGERAEYEGYVRANNFVAILQAKARKLLADGDVEERQGIDNDASRGAEETD